MFPGWLSEGGGEHWEDSLEQVLRDSESVALLSSLPDLVTPGCVEAR